MNSLFTNIEPWPNSRLSVSMSWFKTSSSGMSSICCAACPATIVSKVGESRAIAVLQKFCPKNEEKKAKKTRGCNKFQKLIISCYEIESAT